MPETRDIDKLSEHELARLVPAMPRDEFRAFLADVRARGIIDPLDITPKDVVLDGRHRLRAALELGLQRVPVRVVEPRDDIEHILLAAISRRQLSPSQRAALVVELREHLDRVARARRRQRANLKQTTEVATLPPRYGRTRDTAAALAGVSARTVQDVESVRQADPALFEAIKRGRMPAHTAARRVRQAPRDRQLAAPPLPSGRFELIYADPPWQLGNPTSAYAPENHYPTLPLEQIKA